MPTPPSNSRDPARREARTLVYVGAGLQPGVTLFPRECRTLRFQGCRFRSNYKHHRRDMQAPPSEAGTFLPSRLKQPASSYARPFLPWEMTRAGCAAEGPRPDLHANSKSTTAPPNRLYLFASLLPTSFSQSAPTVRLFDHSRIPAISSARVTLNGCVPRISPNKISVDNCCFNPNAV